MVDESSDSVPGGVVSEGRAEATLFGLRWGVCGYPPPREEGEPRRYNTACTEGQAVQPVTAGDRQPPHVQPVGQGVEVWVPSAVVRILLFKGLTGAQVNGEKRAIASCVLYTGHQ